MTKTVTNTSGNTDCYNVALSEKIPSGWEIFNDRLLGTGSDESAPWALPIARRLMRCRKYAAKPRRKTKRN